MTQRMHFTKAGIDAIPLPMEGSRTYQDRTIASLYLRVSATGARTWSVFKWSRAQRRPLRVALGPYPSIGVELARRKATELLVAIDQGRDPVAEKRATFAVPTLGEISAQYAQRLRAVGRRHPDYLHTTVCLSFKDWLGRRINAISQREVSIRHDAVALERGTVAASRAVKALRTLYRYAEVDLGIEVRNVARSVRVEDSKPRGRFMSPDEERLLRAVLSAESDLVRDYVRLLMATGARRDNVAGMRWADVNLSNATWTIPGSAAKAGSAITVPLMPEALEILQRRKEAFGAGVYVFPSRGKKKRLVEVWHLFERVKARAALLDLGLDWKVEDPRSAVAALDPATTEGKGLGDLTIHDLRRTVAVKLVSTGASLPVVAAALGHKNLKTTQQVYALATQLDVRAAMEKTVNHG